MFEVRSSEDKYSIIALFGPGQEIEVLNDSNLLPGGCSIPGPGPAAVTVEARSFPLLEGIRLFVRFYRLPYKLLRDVMGDFNDPCNPARAFPFD